MEYRTIQCTQTHKYTKQYVLGMKNKKHTAAQNSHKMKDRWKLTNKNLMKNNSYSLHLSVSWNWCRNV